MINGIDYYRRYEPIFDEWKIDKLIGEGSSGEVFRITKNNEDGSESEAALKAICIPKSDMEYKILQNDGFTPESAQSYLESIAANIVREYSLMAQFNGHPNVVAYQDHVAFKHESKVGWDILIRMELLTPISEYFQLKPLKLHDIINLGISMCRALELCHAQNVIHRDVKPENIFADSKGNFKLGDFGIAREIEKTQTGLTKTGTLTYMAPEIFRGEAYGKSIDIYSLGIVLYKFVNHNRIPFSPRYPEPFTYESRDIANEARMKGEKLPYPDGTNFREFSDVILKACSFKPEDRYSSASEMRLALENLLTLPSFGDLISGSSVTEYIRDISADSNEDKKKDDAKKDVNVDVNAKDNVQNVGINVGVNSGSRLKEMPKKAVKRSDKKSKRKTSSVKSKAKTSGKRNRSSSKRSFFDNRLAVVAAVLIPTFIIIGVFAVLFAIGAMNKDNTSEDYPIISPYSKYENVLDKINALEDTYGTASVTVSDDNKDIYYVFFEKEAILHVLPYTGYEIPDSKGSDSYFSDILSDYKHYNVKSIVFDSAITRIGNYAFKGLDSLESIKVNGGEIGSYAFAYCTNLAEVKLTNVVSVEKNAFFDCKSLEKLVFPESVKLIENCVDGCENLSAIEIKNKNIKLVQKKYGDVTPVTPFFQNCDKALVVTVPDECEEYMRENFPPESNNYILITKANDSDT